MRFTFGLNKKKLILNYKVNKKYNMKFYWLALISIFTMIFFSLSCKKAENPKAIVKVVNFQNYGIKDALVIVYAGDSINSEFYIDPIKKIKIDSAYTNAKGEAEFEFTNESVFQVLAKKQIGSSMYSGEAVLYLKNDKIEEKTVVLGKE